MQSTTDEITRLRAELEAAFRAGWIAGHEACGETDVDPDTDSAYQVARQALARHQAAKAAERDSTLLSDEAG